jgi:hypothetical protein
MIITSILQEGTGKIIEGDVSPLMNFCWFEDLKSLLID